MESSQNPIYNLFTNLTRNQKIALCLAVILFISGIIILPQLFQANQSKTNDNDELSNAPKVESYVDEQGPEPCSQKLSAFPSLTTCAGSTPILFTQIA